MGSGVEASGLGDFGFDELWPEQESNLQQGVGFC